MKKNRKQRIITALVASMLVLSLASYANLGYADSTNSQYLWANFGEFSPALQSLWLNMIDNRNEWGFCNAPVYSEDNQQITLVFCHMTARQVLQWAIFTAQTSPQGIRGANVLEVRYGMNDFSNPVWHWLWQPSEQK